MATPRYQAYPLGASQQTINGVCGYHFALRAPLAKAVTLCIFADNGDGKNRETRYPMQADGEIWHRWLAGITVGTRYGFRVSGNSTAQQPLNSNKLLLDPYAKGVVGKPLLDDTLKQQAFLADNADDNAAVAPKSVIVDETFDWGDDRNPQIPWAETIIYELHVKGFTRQHPAIPQHLRGTYAGLAHPAAVDYLQDLGITAVELLPIAFAIDEPHLQRQGLRNYWNYNTLSPFAVETDYAAYQADTVPLKEFKQLVKTLHAAGLEVILDVVFNHSAEAEQHHPMYHYRGVANADFYWLNEDGSCVNHTGCGNTINAAHPATRQWIIDCLCYWVQACHVDGFRFDLGTVLGREPDFTTRAKWFQAITDEPILKNCKLIAEPWDIGWDGYQLGNFPDNFCEWNDRFRGDIRAFFLQESGRLDTLATRLAGSSDIFYPPKLPHNSINFITAHDGFTLADLVSYNDKHNAANAEENRDGDNHNLSYNHGIEGPTDNRQVCHQRRQAQQALLTALLLANGTPMLLAGDEIGRSQQGNNNAYCQDNAISYIDWKTADFTLRDFVKQIITIRKKIPALNQDNWWTDDTVIWLTASGQPMQVHDWQQPANKALQIQINRQFLWLVNGERHARLFILPDGEWCVLDAYPAVTTYRHALPVHHLGFVLLRKKEE